MKTYTEKDTEIFYDEEDEIYRSFWDDKGSLHWGLFNKNNEDYLTASENLTKLMEEKADINSNSNVLDVGCGNGEVTIQLAKKFNCKLIGIDLSGVRIENANKKLKKLRQQVFHSLMNLFLMFGAKQQFIMFMIKTKHYQKYLEFLRRKGFL